MFRRLALTATCAAALTLTGAAAAHAASRTLVDPTGDVWAQDVPRVGQDTQTPHRRQGDIVRTVLEHNQQQVVIRTRFAKLDREGGLFAVVAQLRTNTGKVRMAFLQASPRPATNRWRGDLTWTNRQGSRQLPCATSHRIDYAANVAVIRIPRSCLGNPRTVQGAFAADTGARDTFFVDNPSNQGSTRHRPAYTAPLRRG